MSHDYINGRRSTTRYCTLVGGNLVTWKSKKHHVIARSSAEVEYKAIANGTCEVLMLQSLLKELGMNVKTSMWLYGDNQGVLIS